MQPRRWRTFLHAVLFVLGFSLTFVVGWGGAVTLAGEVFRQYKALLSQIGAVIVILFGVANLGILRIPWLFYDLRTRWKPNRRIDLVSSGLMGVFFAAGWTPCIGTTLGAILTLGFSQDTTGQALLLSSGYALGLGIPFLIIGLGIDRATGLLRHVRPYIRKIQVASGLLLILMGVMILTNQLSLIAALAQRYGLYLDLASGSASNPTYLIAVAAGFVSFMSPCVLPLVPAYIAYLGGRAVA